MNNVYCVCTTPDIYPHYQKNWDNFKESGKDLIWLCDVSKDNTLQLGFNYTEEEIRNNLNFRKELSKKHFWNSNGNRNIIWFYAHFRMLNYYINNPHYDYYWFFDDDVKADDWKGFFDGFENDDSDFMSYFIFKSKYVDTQPNVPKIDDKTFSNEQWFLRFPGDGDVIEKTNQLFGSFFPVVRFSNKAMKTLLDLHKEGYDGYSEGFVPTMLNAKGLKLASIFKPDNTSNYFDDNKINIKHKNIKIEWSWI